MANHIKARKPFPIDEELILPAAKDICSEFVRICASNCGAYSSFN